MSINKASHFKLKVFRSNKRIYAQVIDEKGRVMAAESDLKLIDSPKKTKRERARMVGKKLAEKLLKLKINRLVFERGRYRYLGRVKALVEGVREGGIKI